MENEWKLSRFWISVKKKNQKLTLNTTIRLKIDSNTTKETKEFSKNKQDFKFGSGTFSVAPKTQSNSNVFADLTESSADKTNSAVVVLYEKFEGTLIHDPTISIETPFGIVNLETETLIILSVILFCSIAMMTVLFCGVGLSYIYVSTEGMFKNRYGDIIH